jgi:hypothetical protein
MSDDFDDIYGSRYLAAGDVKKAFTAVISTVEKRDIARQGERQKMKVVLTLKGVNKPVVINKTNAIVLSEAFGKNFDDWPDNRVKVQAERTQFGGKPVMGLRLYPAKTETAPALPKQAKLSDDSENPADFDDPVDDDF